jgi:acyl-CoA synthetase (AMP-forming)/AMP-acid ligase II
LEERAQSDGSLMPGCAIRLVDDAGNAVAEGESGEILSRGPELFSAYVDEALNGQAFVDGWFRSGDVGVMERGLLRVVDRKKDIIIRGGENISSKEIEDIVRQMPGVSEAAAVPYPDRLMGERAAIFVEMRDGHPIDLPAIRQHFEAAGVARQKTPERLVVLPVLPRNATGKVLKTELRKQVAAAEQENG